MSDSALTLRGVSFRYPGSPLLFDNVDLTVPPGGHIECLLGPSGSGKSTLLAIAMGHVIPTTGTVHRANIALPIFQNYRSMVLWWRRVRANIEWSIGHTSFDEIQEVATLLSIDGILRAFPNSLSGGQCQRVVLARALVGHAPLLLLDEPFSSLDVRSAREILPRVRKHMKTHGTSALWVTHNPIEAALVADRVTLVSINGDLQTIAAATDGNVHLDALLAALAG